MATALLVPVRRTAALQAIVYLAVHAQGASSRQLIEAIWPGLPPHAVTGRLYTTLSDLRTTDRSACGLAVIDHSDDRYRLVHDHMDVDLWRFHAAARHAATAVVHQAAAWRAVIDSYTGDLAAGHTWPWLDPPREAARRHVIDAYAAVAAGQSDPRLTLSVLEAGIRVDPYNENLHYRAMRALAALGDHAAVNDLLNSYTRRLAEVGLQPSGHLHDAAAQLRAGHPAGR